MDELTLEQALANSSTLSDTSNLTTLLAWALVPSVIILVVFVVFYIVRSVHRRKVDAAIFEIRNTLREMKLQQAPSQTSPQEEPTVQP